MADIEIYGTGSSGNCACINGDVIIDLGLRKGCIPERAVRRASAVLVTHEHADHLCVPTFNWLCGLRPDLVSRQFFANRSTRSMLISRADEHGRRAAERMPEANTVGRGWVRDVRTRSGIYRVEAFDCPHGYGNERYCENYGFVLRTPDGEDIVWATDTTAMDFCPERKFDCVAVEGNYRESDLFTALGDPLLRDRARRNLRHLSVEEFELFASTHAKEGAEIIQLHMSEDFGWKSPLDNHDWGDLAATGEAPGSGEDSRG